MPWMSVLQKMVYAPTKGFSEGDLKTSALRLRRIALVPFPVAAAAGAQSSGHCTRSSLEKPRYADSVSERFPVDLVAAVA